MIIGILQSKGRGDVCLTPECISVLVQNNHSVLIEGDVGSAFFKAYLHVGAYIIDTREELLDRADLIVKKSWAQISEISYLNGERKIFFTKVNLKNKTLIDKLLEQKISLLNYPDLEGFKKGKVNSEVKLEFSNYLLPFLLELADNRLDALVDDEILRQSLLLMHGKVYNNQLASLYNMPCYEF